jgi:hypothetical protein
MSTRPRAPGSTTTCTPPLRPSSTASSASTCSAIALSCSSALGLGATSIISLRLLLTAGAQEADRQAFLVRIIKRLGEGPNEAFHTQNLVVGPNVSLDKRVGGVQGPRCRFLLLLSHRMTLWKRLGVSYLSSKKGAGRSRRLSASPDLVAVRDVP